MKYEKLKISSEKNFRRVTGVKRKTFEVLVSILKEAQKIKRQREDVQISSVLKKCF